jgi:hypothetical protein
MADRYRTPDEWTVEVVQLGAGERLRIRHHGFYVADFASGDQLGRWIPAAERTSPATYTSKRPGGLAPVQFIGPIRPAPGHQWENVMGVSAGRWTGFTAEELSTLRIALEYLNAPRWADLLDELRRAELTAYERNRSGE